MSTNNSEVCWSGTFHIFIGIFVRFYYRPIQWNSNTLTGLFWNRKVDLGDYYKLKKNRFQNKLDFLSSSNLIFTACVACKNQFDFLNLIFRNWKKIEWHSIFQKSSEDRQGVSLPYRLCCLSQFCIWKKSK